MTPSVTEYHFFFLTHEDDEIPSEKEQAGQILRSLLRYLEKGRLQVLTLYLSEQFPSSEVTLTRYELAPGSLPARPKSFSQALGLPAKLLDMKPAWRLQHRWNDLHGCTMQPGPNNTMRLFVRTTERGEGSEGILIHGAIGELPGRALVDSMIGRRLLGMAGMLLPGDQARGKIELLSGSRLHVELLDSSTDPVGLQPLVVIKATAD